MIGDMRKNSEIQRSKTDLRKRKEIMVNIPEIKFDTIAKMESFLLLVKRYTQRGTIVKQSKITTSVKSF